MADAPDREKEEASLEADDLYALDPADFVAARKDLVRRLRAAGRRDDAARAATRRRPSPVAWALDQVARHDPELVDRALTTGARLRAATEAAVAGDAAQLRAATAEDRAASEAVVGAAQRRLGERGPALRPQLAATLRAAALDDQLGAELRRGVLATDHDAPGFGWSAFDESTTVPAPPPPRGRQRGRSAPAGAGSEPAEAPVEPDPPALEDRRRARAEAEERAREERRRAGEEARVARLEEQAADLTRVAERAEAAARRARAEADGAAAEARDARRALDER